MKNITSKTKTILFAALITAMILPFSSMNVAVADEGDVNPRIGKLEQKIAKKEALIEQKTAQLEEITNPDRIDKLAREINELKNHVDALYQRLVDVSKSEKTISTNKLIKRIGEKWQSYYSTQEEFDAAQSEIEAYVDADLPKNEWNKKMVKEQIKQHNFESIIGKKGHGHELVSLYVAKQKMNGNYNATEPVTKYHKWATQKYPSPDTKKQINERILDIVGDKNLEVFTKKMVRSLNTMAQHGNVPPELSGNDPHYWMSITGAAVCMYESDCDSESMYANAKLPKTTPEQLQAIKEFEKNQGIDPVTGEPMTCSFLLPCAEAGGWKKVDKKHTVTAKVKIFNCESGTCNFTKEQTKTGTITLDVIPSGMHKYVDNGLHVEAISQSDDSVALNTVKGEIIIGYGKNSISDTGLGKASYNKYLKTDKGCGGRIQNCGTMSYFVTSDATKWIKG